jgi:2'-5' RNA ligase
LAKNGIPFDGKPFSPHITIAREVITDTKIRISPCQSKMHVDGFSLMRSDRINGKLTYTQIYRKEITG